MAAFQHQQQQQKPDPESGQALIEYALIIILLVLSFALALAATGDRLGNVFSNVINSVTGNEIDAIGRTTLPDADEFWMTVTWAAQQTPVEERLPSRTPAPPTPLPTDGPSPTPSPTIPTNTPAPTRTDLPSPTPRDKIFDYDWHDSAEDGKADWRLDNTFFISGDDWYGQYYANETLSGTPFERRYNAQINNDYFGQVDFFWNNGSPILGMSDDQYSVSWRRNIYISELSTMRFDLSNVNDGVRIWITGEALDDSGFAGFDYGGDASVETGSPGNCSSISDNNGGTITSGDPDNLDGWQVFDDSRFGYNPAGGGRPPEECLIVSRWENNAGSRSNIRRTVPRGIYTIQVDYYEAFGNGAGIQLEISSPSVSSNPQNSGQCGWYDREENNRSNSLNHMWDEGDQGDNSLCYLELRGAVDVPAASIAPALTWRDVWDIRPGSNAFLEVAPYDANDDGQPDRDPNQDGDLSDATITWTRVPVHTGDTYNYNWTYQYYDLSAFRGQKVAVRFGLDINGQSSSNRWWIDTIKVEDTVVDSANDLYTALEWDMDDQEDYDDFILTGWWSGVTQNTYGGGGMALHESPNSSYPGNEYRPIYAARTYNQYGERRNARIYSAEFKGFIDVNNAAGATDLEGDQGDPILTFWHSYDLDRRTGLEIQYSTRPYGTDDNNANWQPVPLEGVIVEWRNNSRHNLDIMEEVKIPLNSIPVSRFRLRFALIIPNDGQPDPGWWIDQISLQREGRPKFTRFPFIDRAEDPLDIKQWELLGGWGRVSGGYANSAGSYTDSPDGNYLRNRNYVFQLKDPIDMYLDTPTNVNSAVCNQGALCEVVDTAPVDPVMSFWFRRSLGGGDDFYVEWKREEEGSNAWRYLWGYEDRMQTSGTGNRTATRVSIDWERVYIDMKPIMNDLIANNDAGSDTEDDIEIRFIMDTNGGGESDGIYLDDIEIKERLDQIVHLWAPGEVRLDINGDQILDPNGNTSFGDGESYYDSVDNNPELFNGAWHMGGDWNAVNWESHGGVYSFHDSDGEAGEQDVALDYNNNPNAADNYVVDQAGETGTIIKNAHDTFNVLEMNSWIDLRGVEVNEQPMMYFWTRFAVGNSDRISVQIAYKDDDFISNPECRNNYQQCYEKLYGWSEWEEVWFFDHYDRNFTWHRIGISLSNYAKSGTTADGKIIRVRFVTDALDSTPNWDGWYIDDITFEHYDPRVITIGGATNQAFFDAARNMKNWIPEGQWGLSPEFFRGAGGGPVNLGSSVWNYKLWDLDPCPGGGDFRTCVDRFFTNTGANTAATTTPHAQNIALDINNNWGNGGPFGLRNRFAGRWELTTGTVGAAIPAGDYTFITASDDGIRMKYEVASGSDSTVPAGWNIIDNWTYHGRTVDMGVAKFVAGNRYKLTVEYFESSSSATLTVSTGSNSFSFTDSPKQGRGSTWPENPAQPRSSSSLLLDGAFDLTDATQPLIEYYTYHEMGGVGRVEVTQDGGFSWTQDGLEGTLAGNYWNGNWRADYFQGRNLDFTGASVFAGNVDVGTDLDFNWGSNTEPIAGLGRDNYSVRYTRTLTLPFQQRITFKTRADDGVRLWIDYPGNTGCADGDGVTRFSGQPRVHNRKTFSDGCLLIDNWRNQGPTTTTVDRTLPAGTYTIQVDYYESGGGAEVSMDAGPSAFDSPNYGGTHMPDPEADMANDWRQKTHDFTAYAGVSQLGLRFRFDRLGDRTTDEGNNYQARNQTGASFTTNWMESWWIVDIRVVDP